MKVCAYLCFLFTVVSFSLYALELKDPIGPVAGAASASNMSRFQENMVSIPFEQFSQRTVPGMIYVDDDAPNDPEPNNIQVSDPFENGTVNHPYDSVQEAIAIADVGDIVCVNQGTYSENIEMNQKQLTVTAIDPNHPEFTVLSGDDHGSVVLIADSSIQITGLTLTGGSAQQGGGIHCRNSKVAVSGCTITGNKAITAGGAVYADNSNLLLEGCSILNNRTTDGADGDRDDEATDIPAGSGEDTGDGGGLYVQHGNLILASCLLEGNSTGHAGNGVDSALNTGGAGGDSGSGGALYSQNAIITITGCDFKNNSTGYAGDGGYGVEWDMGGLSGTAGSGGGLHVSGSKITINDSRFRSNKTGKGGNGYSVVDNPNGFSGSGGGIYLTSSKIELNNLLITENYTSDGGSARYDGIDSFGARAGHGGGLAIIDCNSFVIDQCIVRKNYTGQGGNASGTGRSGGTGGFGGGVYVSDCKEVTISDCSIIDNKAGDAGSGYFGGKGGSGAGIYCNSVMLQVLGSDFSNNYCGARGGGELSHGGDGGAICAMSAVGTIVDCNFIGNMAGTGGSQYGEGFEGYNGSGGAIFSSKRGEVANLNIYDSNFYDNTIHHIDGWYSGSQGYGGAVCGDRIDCKNSIFKGNEAVFGSGGAISCDSLVDQDSLFMENYGQWGGAVDCHDLSVNGVVYQRNSGGYMGGAILCKDLLSVQNSRFTGNSSNQGAAIYVGHESYNNVISNSIFNENTVLGVYDFPEAVVSARGGLLIIDRCTFTSNQAESEGFAIRCGYNSVEAVVKNSIMWDDLSPFSLSNATLIVQYSDVYGGWPGIGNINADPLFADPVHGDFHLQSTAGRWDPNSLSWVNDLITSPCIDAGDPDDPAWANELWPHGMRVNMGAYGGTAKASKSPAEAGNIADIVSDGCVQIQDLIALIEQWLRPQILSPEDLNGDNRINLADFAVFAQNWGLCYEMGLVGHWAFSETEGTVAYDTSGYQNHGTLVNGPTWTGSGQLSFDGIDDYVEVADSTYLRFANHITISAWVRLLEDSDRFMKIIVKPSSTQVADPWENFCLDLRRKNPRFILSEGVAGTWTGAYDVTWDSPIEVGSWVHMAGTYDGQTMRLYVNGQLTQNHSVSLMIGSNDMPLYIGGRRDTDSFAGQIDDIRLYNRALSDAEIQALFYEH